MIQDIDKKIKLIFIPFLIVFISFVLSYTFLNWLLFVQLKLFPVKEIIRNFLIPFILTLLVVFIWIRPRINLLSLYIKRGGDPYFLYQFIAVIIISPAIMIAQSYMETATGSLTPLESIDQIEQFEETKYYTVRGYYIDTENIGIVSTFEVSGKYNNHLNMYLYIAMPIYSSKEDTSNQNCSTFIGKKYHKQISNNANESEKQFEYNQFTRKSMNEFAEYNPSEFIYLDRIFDSEDRDNFIRAARQSEISNNGSFIILMPVNEPFDLRNGKKVNWLLGVFFVGSFVWFLMILFPKFSKDELADFEKGKRTDDGEVEFLKLSLLPRDGFIITPILVYLNLSVFMILVFAGYGPMSFNAHDLLVWGANSRPYTIHGEWWRLITSMFLHGGLMHITVNLFVLLFVGQILEPVLQTKKYLLVYMGSGIFADLASLVWNDVAVSVGASGAIFGLYGVFIVLMLKKYYPPFIRSIYFTSILIYIGLNVLLGIFRGGIDNAAHIGGLICGIAAGFIIRPTLKKKLIKKIKLFM